MYIICVNESICLSSGIILSSSGIAGSYGKVYNLIKNCQTFLLAI